MNQLWVCQACGREGPSREALRDRDTSCGTWAVRVDPGSVVRGPGGKIVKADAWEPENPDETAEHMANALGHFADADVDSKVVDSALKTWQAAEDVKPSWWPWRWRWLAGNVGGDVPGGEG